MKNLSERDVCYKIKTTRVSRYAVLPGQALIPARGEAVVEIVLIKMDALPAADELNDRFLVQALFKEDPAEDVIDFWKRSHNKGDMYQKKFASTLSLPDENDITAQREDDERQQAR